MVLKVQVRFRNSGVHRCLFANSPQMFGGRNPLAGKRPLNKGGDGILANNGSGFT